jgi:uncharacterized protein YfiM (DUF2279 family)
LKSTCEILLSKITSFSLLLLLLTHTVTLLAQDSIQAVSRFNKKRFTGVMIAGVSAYGITMAGLHEAWYKENARSNFHFFDDLHQWQQIDKAGHFYSTYHLSHTSSRIFEWTGISSRKAVWLGALTGILLMLPIEIQDGFSSDYGASWSDLLANTSGAALSLQRLWWQQPRIHPKFSFHPTAFAPRRPNTLGSNLPQRLLKDYNGQTYWLALDVQPWLGSRSKFPAWLNLALGYGATNMLYADKGVNQLNGYDTYRQYYISLDVNFTRIPASSKFIKSVFFLLNTVRIPAPALEFNKKGMKLHPLYF